MKILVDTQILLWQFSEDRRFRGRLKDMVLDPDTDIVVSDVSRWEVVIKHRLGKLAIALSEFERECTENRYDRLPIRTEHFREVDRLELFHRDPFDRLLIGQGVAERLPILTADGNFAAYPVRLALR